MCNRTRARRARAQKREHAHPRNRTDLYPLNTRRSRQCAAAGGRQSARQSEAQQAASTLYKDSVSGRSEWVGPAHQSTHNSRQPGASMACATAADTSPCRRTRAAPSSRRGRRTVACACRHYETSHVRLVIRSPIDSPVRAYLPTVAFLSAPQRLGVSQVWGRTLPTQLRAFPARGCRPVDACATAGRRRPLARALRSGCRRVHKQNVANVMNLLVESRWGARGRRAVRTYVRRAYVTEDRVWVGGLREQLTCDWYACMGHSYLKLPHLSVRSCPFRATSLAIELEVP